MWDFKPHIIYVPKIAVMRGLREMQCAVSSLRHKYTERILDLVHKLVSTFGRHAKGLAGFHETEHRDNLK